MQFFDRTLWILVPQGISLIPLQHPSHAFVLDLLISLVYSDSTFLMVYLSPEHFLFDEWGLFNFSFQRCDCMLLFFLGKLVCRLFKYSKSYGLLQVTLYITVLLFLPIVVYYVADTANAFIWPCTQYSISTSLACCSLVCKHTSEDHDLIEPFSGLIPALILTAVWFVRG